MEVVQPETSGLYLTPNVFNRTTPSNNDGDICNEHMKFIMFSIMQLIY